MRDFENSFLAVDTPDGMGCDDLLGHSITYRIAPGPHQGREAFTVANGTASARRHRRQVSAGRRLFVARWGGVRGTRTREAVTSVPLISRARRPAPGARRPAPGARRPRLRDCR